LLIRKDYIERKWIIFGGPACGLAAMVLAGLKKSLSGFGQRFLEF
jgi:hypothetical protein